MEASEVPAPTRQHTLHVLHMHQGTCLRTSSTAPPQMHHLHTEPTGESLGARTPCECSLRSLRPAARKPKLTPTSPHICDIRESFQRHILPPVMPCCLASSFSREHNEAYTLLDLQRPASDWASCCQLPSFCDTSLRSGRVLS
jgi:hypothetical protein